MKRKERNVLVFLIVAVIVAAVFASFGLPLFYGDTPTITLPNPAATDRGGQGDEEQALGVRVEVTPETVQSVIAAMSRLDSYGRTVTTTLAEATFTAQVQVDGAWTQSVLTASGAPTAHTLVGPEQVWRWYEGDREAASWPAEEGSRDLEGQRIPTYEDVLALDKGSITAAGYQEKNGASCVYVEVAVPALDQVERYWVSADSGLLWCAETESAGEIVWTMTATLPETPLPAGTEFALPDGTLLHRVGEAR